MAEPINVKRAVEIATEFAEQIYGSGEEGALEAVQVEEVEYLDEQGKWLIKLGWNEKGYKEIPSAEMAGIRFRAIRTYRVFHIDAEKGEVVKMEGADKS